MKSDSNNPVREKSYSFALYIIKVCTQLSENNKEYILSNQLLKSGTSVGANVEEAIGAQSKKDFLSKMSIAYKEARESKYWIRLLTDSNKLGETESEQLIELVDELLKIIGSIIKTLKNNS